VNEKMKKRGVSPVIATVLLIALVTAAAAIVFLVVIPMLQPNATALVTGVVGSADGDGNYTVIITVQAEGADLVYNGTVTCSPTLTYLSSTTAAGLSIPNGETKTITIVGSFQLGVDHTITLYFTSGESEAVGTANYQPS
jgi:flagellin-like protein